MDLDVGSIGVNATSPTQPRTLVAGWFSFTGTGATVGDVMAKDVVCAWLDEAGMPYDVAIVPAFGPGVDWRTVDPSRYSHVVFVCGPFYRSDLLRRFERSKLVGVNLSMTEPVALWNPFDLLYERDSEDEARPDLAFGAPLAELPVVGFVPLPSGDADRGERGDTANELLRRLLVSRRVAVALLDTRLEGRVDGVSVSPAAIESLIRRLDLVVTVRLHGLALALRNGVPALAIDPVDGGGKILRQAKALGWPAVLHVGEATDRRLAEAFEFCLSDEAKTLARERAASAADQVAALGASFVDRIGDATPPPDWGDGRRRGTWGAPTGADGSRGQGDGMRSLMRRGLAKGVRSADRVLRAIERRL